MKRLHEVDIIRTIAILLVVFTHCFAIYNGAWKYPTGTDFEPVYVYKIFTRFIAAFRMPAVVLVAGYVFNYMKEKNTKSLWSLSEKKFKRLIIPSLLFTSLYMALFLNDLATTQKIITLTNGAGHLWFLPMLFWNFIIGYFILKHDVDSFRGKILIAGFLFIISIAGPVLVPNVFGFARTLSFTLYFYIGIQLFNYRDTIVDKLSSRYIFSGIMLFTILFIGNEIVLFKTDHMASNNTVKLYSSVYKPVMRLMGVILFYAIVLYYVEIKGFVSSQLFKNLSKKTYGIYVFHQFILQIMIYRFNIYQIIDYRVAPIIYFVFSFVISLFITNVFLKTRVGRFLIG